MKKRIITILMVAFLAILQVGIVRANAEMLPFSSDIFLHADVNLQTTGLVTFVAKTHQRTTIKVDSCILQKMEGGNWVFDQSLTCPTCLAIMFSDGVLTILQYDAGEFHVAVEKAFDVPLDALFLNRDYERYGLVYGARKGSRDVWNYHLRDGRVTKSENFQWPAEVE